MADVTDAQLDAAEERGRLMLKTEPRATSARYEPATGCVVVELVNGCSYSFPARLVEDLQGASADALAGVEVDGLGFNLHWPALDADLYVPALMAGVFGTRACERWPAGARGTITSGMNTMDLETSDTPRPETEIERQRRIAREARELVHARASAAAGRAVESTKVKAWIDSIGTDHEMPVPYSGR